MALPYPYSIQQISASGIVNSSIIPNDLTDSNNNIQSSRVIDQVSQDYVLNSNGTFVGQSAVNTSVYLALFTTFNSSAVSGLGNQLKSIKMITPNINKQVFNIITQSLTSLINQNLVSLVSCLVQNNGSGVTSVNVVYKDLTVNSENQKIQTINVLLPQL